MYKPRKMEDFLPKDYKKTFDHMLLMCLTALEKGNVDKETVLEDIEQFFQMETVLEVEPETPVVVDEALGSFACAYCSNSGLISPRKARNEGKTASRYCSSCGTRVDWDNAAEEEVLRKSQKNASNVPEEKDM